MTTPDDPSQPAGDDPLDAPPAAGPPSVPSVPASSGELIDPPVGPGRGAGASDDGGVMSLVDHLTELRNRIAWSALAVAIGAVVGFVVGPEAIKFLSSPLPKNFPIYTTGPGDAFAIRIQIALVIGVILGMPAILWNVWRFIAPGLTDRERRAILPWIPATLVFFAIGVTIAFIVLPYAMAFLLSFQTPELQPLLNARDYFGFVTTMFLAFGLLMEFPILLVGLSRVGIITSDRLRRSRRMVILGIAIFAAVATPGGDLVSPTVLGVTLYLLYEGTVVVIRRSGR